MPHPFGEKLRWLRHQSELTQAALAERLGLTTQAHIANLEADHDAPSLQLVLRVARLFDVPTDYLLRETVPIDGAELCVVELPLDTTLPQLFGPKLRALREQRNWGQTMLAQQLGLARRGYISNLETGRKAPSLDLVVRIADLFGVTTDELLRDEVPLPATES